MNRPRLRLGRPGLRIQLIAVFLIVAVAGSLAIAVLTVRHARDDILKRTQRTSMQALANALSSVMPVLPARPGRRDLQEAVTHLDEAGSDWHWRTTASYGPDLAVTTRTPGGRWVASKQLSEQALARNATVMQRVEHSGHGWLVIAMPVQRKANHPVDLVVTAEFSLGDEEIDIASLVRGAQAGAVPAAALAIVLAVLAAGRVLRPVRQLRNAAEEIAGGRLGTRLPPDTGRDELAGLARAFNTMAATLESDQRELRRHEARARRFAADVSHELRTPLAAMTAASEVLNHEAASLNLTPEATDTLRLISDETLKLARLIDDLMEISRFDAGAAVLHLDDIDIAQAVAETLRLRNWHNQVTVGLPPGLRARLDPRRLDVVLANLIGNALRHGAPPVSVLAHTDGYQLIIEVTDQGPGIPEDVLPHVFDRFYKADTARTRSPGSGLGLAIAAENVRLHHGSITTANHPHGGAQFTAAFPLTPPTTRQETSP